MGGGSSYLKVQVLLVPVWIYRIGPNTRPGGAVKLIEHLKYACRSSKHSYLKVAKKWFYVQKIVTRKGFSKDLVTEHTGFKSKSKRACRSLQVLL